MGDLRHLNDRSVRVYEEKVIRDYESLLAAQQKRQALNFVWLVFLLISAAFLLTLLPIVFG